MAHVIIYYDNRNRKWLSQQQQQKQKICFSCLYIHQTVGNSLIVSFPNDLSYHNNKFLNKFKTK